MHQSPQRTHLSVSASEYSIQSTLGGEHRVFLLTAYRLSSAAQKHPRKTRVCVARSVLPSVQFFQKYARVGPVRLRSFFWA